MPKLLTSRLVQLGVLALLVATLAACAPASPSPSASASQAEASEQPSATGSPSVPAEASEPLVQALAFLTLETTRVAFTDWAAMKAAAGVADLSGATPLEERLAFMRSLAYADALDTPAAFLSSNAYFQEGLLTHWSFDNLDLAWEAELTVTRGVVHVLRFPDDFDLGVVAAHFDERGFTSELLGGATLRSHAMDAGEEWILGTDPAFLNTAFMPDGHTLVLSFGPEAIEAILTADPSGLGSAAFLLDAVAALEEPTAAYLSFDLSRTCAAQARPAVQPAVDALLAQAGLLHPYTVMAIGNRGTLSPPGRIVFGYTDPADAAADLPGRELLARDGVTLDQGAPIRERIFTLVDASVAGGSLVLTVDAPQPGPLPSGQPTPRLARFLFNSWIRGEFLIGACDIGA